jgi:hypothetical protein
VRKNGQVSHFSKRASSRKEALSFGARGIEHTKKGSCARDVDDDNHEDLELLSELE